MEQDKHDETKPQGRSESNSSKGFLRRLEEKLYSKKGPTALPESGYSHLRPHDISRRSGWGSLDKNGGEAEKDTFQPMKQKTRFTTKFLVASIAFFVIAAGIAAFVLLSGANVISTKNVDIQITGPLTVEAGDELALELAFVNKNAVGLKLADLLIEYPEGTRAVGSPESELTRARRSLGSIASGETVRESTQMVLFGQEGDEKEIKVTLEYRVEDSNAIFVTEETYKVVISSSPIRLRVIGVKETSSGQAYTIEARVASNANEQVQSILLSVEYPFGFSVTDTTPEPTYGDDTWFIGDMPPDSERVITIQGKLLGQDGEEKIFRIKGGIPSTSNKKEIGIAYGSVLHTVTVTRPFLDIRTSLGGSTKDKYVAESDKSINAEIFWTNNLPTKVEDVRIEARLSGNAIDKTQITAENGFYNSNNNTIVWDGVSERELKSIEPGGQGKVRFRVTPAPLVTTSGGVREEPTIIILITASGTRDSEGNGSRERIETTDKRTILVVSDVTLSARAVYYEGPFTNSGPVPPKAEEETTYTIVWNVVNTASDIAGGIVTATLPRYVRFVGRVSPSGEEVSYSDTERTVTWELGRVDSGTGINTRPREAAFQIAVVPSVSQVGTIPVLVDSPQFRGYDTFTETNVEIIGNSVNTKLSTDPQFRFGDDKVVE